MIVKNPRKRIGQEGFTLVELMIVVAIIGILAVLAIFGVSRYLTNAKTAEARNALGQIAKSAVAAYEQERTPSALIAAGQPGTTASNDFCLNAVDNMNVPAAVPQNTKFQSAIANWGGTATTGWTCLRYSMTEPQYFQYGYTGVTQSGFNGWAAANFSNGATATNGYSLGGALTNGQVIVQPAIAESEGGSGDNTPTKTVPTAGGGSGS